MKLGIKIGLPLIIIVLCYLVYDSIVGKIQFEKEIRHRRELVIERLKDIRIAQLAYKSVERKYANDFYILLDFLKHGSFPVIKALGTVPDTLTEEEAMHLGLVTRDTTFVYVKDSLFSSTYLQDHLGSFSITSMPYIPFGKGAKFAMEAGVIEKGKVKVQVFEVFASFEFIYKGLETENEGIELSDGLKVGSMTEPSTSGNWGE